MSDLKQTISSEIIKGMKAKDKTRLNALRYVKKLFIENDTSNKPISELDIIIGYAKKVKDSAALYPEGCDAQLEIYAEHKVLSEFLPAELSVEEVQTMIDLIINSFNDSTQKPNMGLIMKALQPKIKGQFDGKLASDMVKKAVA